MIEGPIKPQESVYHIRDGTEYIVMSGSHMGGANETTAIVKVGHAGAKKGWISAIAYYDPHESDKIFVRDEATFRESFERVVR